MKEPYFDYFSEGNLKCFQMFAILKKCYNKYCLYFLPHCSIISLGYSPRGRTARSDAMNLKASDEHIALEIIYINRHSQQSPSICFPHPHPPQPQNIVLLRIR